MPRIYCAGPLFNDSERAEMQKIASVLEGDGFSTFLPHRDGLEFAKLRPALARLVASDQQAENILNRAIFSLDVFQLLESCDAVVANLNGRVPDEGTVVEATLAWHAGKPLVLYKADSRAMLNGSDNPMVSGLGQFVVCKQFAALSGALHDEITRGSDHRVSGVVSTGAEITNLRRGNLDDDALAVLLMQLLG